jgi:NADH-quinone oxidoreductase subunit H
MSGLLFAIMVLAGTYLVATLEAWASTGRWAWARPVRAGLALFARESLRPAQADRILFELAPPLLLVAGVLAISVFPLSPALLGVPLSTGALFVNAALAYVLVAMVMAGWAPNGALAMVGGFRFLGQLVGYSMLIVMPITGVAMRARSLANADVVTSQAALPNCLAQPLGFALFIVAAMALASLPPFDVAVAPGELAEGVWGEYTGAHRAVIRLARLLVVLTLSLATTDFFLAGWLGPWLPPWAWSSLKTLAVAAAMLWGGRYFPRVRSDRFLAGCWKVGIPLALVNILWVGVTLLWVAG